jgi:heat shock protein HtpX
MFIIKPFTGQSIMRLFSTHPSTEERIARLQGNR